MESIKRNLYFLLFLGIFSVWLTLRMLEAADLWPNAVYHITPLLGVWGLVGAIGLYCQWPRILAYASAKRMLKVFFLATCAVLPVFTGILGFCIRVRQIGFGVDL